MLRPEDSQQCLEAVLSAGTWELGEYTFATGRPANNKLFMERVLQHPEASKVILRSLGQLVLQHEPDVLWGVPAGGQEYAMALGAWLGIGVVMLEKEVNEAGRKTFRYKRARDRIRMEGAQCAVGVEDVTTTFTSIKGALLLPELQEKTLGAVAVWRRGQSDSERQINIPVHWLIEEPLPNHITTEHPFYKRYGHRAVRQQTA